MGILGAGDTENAPQDVGEVCRSDEVTMTSLELVDFINGQRQPGEAVLRHADFLKKVPLVLNGDAVNFYSVYLGGNGQQRPMYAFPKREACLMAMSYSYEIQAKVWDRMTLHTTMLSIPCEPLRGLQGDPLASGHPSASPTAPLPQGMHRRYRQSPPRRPGAPAPDRWERRQSVGHQS